MFSEQSLAQPLTEAVAQRTATITVWGAGFIGLSAAQAFVDAGYKCKVIDVDPERVTAVNAGHVPLPGFEDRVRIDSGAITSGSLTAMLPDSPHIAGSGVHIVCVNTDRAGLPIDGPLTDVLSRIAALRSPSDETLVCIESTVRPSWLSKLVVPALEHGAGTSSRLHLATAPRRDWMLSPDMNIKTLPRVVGVAQPSSRALVAQLYAAVTTEVHFARDWIHAGLTKSVENLFRYIDLILTNQLCDAYPELDMVEILRLAGTKWNVPTYHPSLGIGGYCIPLSPYFAGDEHLESGGLPIVDSAVEWNDAYADRLAAQILATGPGPYGILGISYAADARIFEGSPSVALAVALKRRGAQVLLHDPFFDKNEVYALTANAAMSYPADLACIRTLIVATAHSVYKNLPAELKKLPKSPHVLDNMGVFRAELAGAVRYTEIGGLPYE